MKEKYYVKSNLSGKCVVNIISVITSQVVEFTTFNTQAEPTHKNAATRSAQHNSFVDLCKRFVFFFFLIFILSVFNTFMII